VSPRSFRSSEEVEEKVSFRANLDPTRNRITPDLRIMWKSCNFRESEEVEGRDNPRVVLEINKK
jgi:hypothetical protein